MPTPSNAVSRRQFLGTAAAGAATLIASTRAVAAEQWQIGCFTRPFSEFEYPVALDAIAEAGFKYAGLMTAKSEDSLIISVNKSIEHAQKVGEACKQRGLLVPSAYGGDIPLAEGLEPAIAGMKCLIDQCAAAGVRDLMMGGIGEQGLYETYYKAISESCGYAAEKGIGISVKPHGGLNATGPQCRKCVEFVGKPNFKIWYDPANIFYYSDATLNPVDDAPTVDGLVAGMSVKDFRKPKDVSVTPGTGLVELERVIGILMKGGFTSGPLLVECLAPGTLPQLIEEAKKARTFVEELVARLG